MLLKKKKARKIKKWLLVGTTIFLVLVVGLALSSFIYQKVYAGKIYPGIKVGNFNLSSKTPKEALEILTSAKEEIIRKGLVFKYKGKEVVISPVIASPLDPDLSYRILNFYLEESVEEAYQIGRSQGWLKNLFQQATGLVYGQTILATYDLNIDELKDILKINFSEFDEPAQKAQLKLTNGEIKVLEEKRGKIIDYQEAVLELIKNLSYLENQEIELTLKNDLPEVYRAETTEAIKMAEELFATSTPLLIYRYRKWEITKEQLGDWLEFAKQPMGVGLKFNQASTTEYLTEIAEIINVEARDAKFKMTGNRVTEFQASRDGKELNIEATYQELNDYLDRRVRQVAGRELELIVEITPAKVAIGDVNEFGIKELIGLGESNFAGSPRNRIHNIGIGAKTLNGILIEPDEEFSLLEAIGEVDEEHGYLPELVIKGNETIPEYGGGLCQIGTTAFRVALDAGLPILERRNHSYRVPYYEPAGMDATIYNPRPDFRFKNDTGHHILFQTEISGYDLIFRFYGTSDGRQIEITEPEVYNIVAPGPTKIVETLDLPVGQKKCTERAHWGADAKFTRTITQPDGEVVEEEWQSHYVPWREVCLVGVEELSSATSTEEILEE